MEYILMQPPGDAKQWEGVATKMIKVFGRWGMLTDSGKSGKIAADACDIHRRCGPTSKLIRPADRTARRRQMSEVEQE